MSLFFLFKEWCDKRSRSFPMCMDREVLSKDLIISKSGVELFDFTNHVVDAMVPDVS